MFGLPVDVKQRRGLGLGRVMYKEWQRIKKKREYRNKLYRRQKEAREAAALEEATKPAVASLSTPEIQKTTAEHVIIENMLPKHRIHYLKSYQSTCPECGGPNLISETKGMRGLP